MVRQSFKKIQLLDFNNNSIQVRFYIWKIKPQGWNVNIPKFTVLLYKDLDVFIKITTIETTVVLYFSLVEHTLINTPSPKLIIFLRRRPIFYWVSYFKTNINGWV